MITKKELAQGFKKSIAEHLEKKSKKPVFLLRHEPVMFLTFATKKARKQAEKNGEFEELVIDYVFRNHQHVGRKGIPMVESLVIERMARESIARREKAKLKKLVTDKR